MQEHEFGDEDDPCPECAGTVKYDAEDDLYVCTDCGWTDEDEEDEDDDE